MLECSIRNCEQFLMRMATVFEIKGSVSLEPIWWQEPPAVSVALDDQEIFQGPLEHAQKFDFQGRLSIETHVLTIEFLNKCDGDTDLSTGRDKAIKVRSVEFFGIESPRFVWAAEYRPRYNQQWAQQQAMIGQAPHSVLKGHDYLGWNGVWQLTFTVPIFTWIHGIEDLGWIFD